MEWTRRLEYSGNPLTELHQSAFHEVSHLYDHQDPRETQTYIQRGNDAASRMTMDHRRALVNTVSEYMSRLGASAASFEQLERLLDPASVAVVTGQQAGLFTGPLYTLYKAMSAIGMAQRLEQELQRPVVPVFWVASEDHDWGEVDHAYLLDESDDVRRIRVSSSPPQHQMVYRSRVSDVDAAAALQEAYQCLPDGPLKTDVLSFLQSAHQASDNMAEWFARILQRMVEPYGLVIVDPCLPGLRSLVGTVWMDAIERRFSVQQHLTESYRDVTAMGFEPAVIRDEDNSTLFYVTDDGRRYVLAISGENTLTARGLGLEMTVAEWKRLAMESPSSFSSNVLLRPVVQDVLLPTLAYVGGPSEIAYHALAKGTFHAHGRTLPPLMLRDRLLLIPPSVQRNLTRWNLQVGNSSEPIPFHERRLRDLGGHELETSLQEIMMEMERLWHTWSERFAHVGPQLDSMVKSQISREQSSMERLRGKALSLLAIRHDHDLRQLRHVERWLWTDGHPQERRVCPLNVWTRYGLDWIQELPFWGDYQQAGAVYQVQL